MTRTVLCTRFKEELPGLNAAPFPGPRGQEIFETVSAKAWQEWSDLQTMLINENRLTPIEAKDRKFLETEMDKYFFGEGSEAPKDFIQPK